MEKQNSNQTNQNNNSQLSKNNAYLSKKSKDITNIMNNTNTNNLVDNSLKQMNKILSNPEEEKNTIKKINNFSNNYNNMDNEMINMINITEEESNKNITNNSLINFQENEYERNLTQDEILKYLRQLFEKYCQFGDRLNTSKMSLSKYRKLMKDTGMEEHLPIKEFDLIFTKLTNSKQYKEFYNKNLRHNSINDISNSASIIIKNKQEKDVSAIKTIDFEGFLQTLVMVSEKIVTNNTKV